MRISRLYVGFLQRQVFIHCPDASVIPLGPALYQSFCGMDVTVGIGIGEGDAVVVCTTVTVTGDGAARGCDLLVASTPG